MTTTDEAAPSVPTAIEALIRFYQDHLAEVRFPGHDAAVLTAAAAKVRDADAAVARSLLALEAARAALRDAQDALATKGQRALAYATVYAEDDPALRARLELLATPEARNVPAAAASEVPRRRGRSPKSERPALFFDGSDTSAPRIDDSSAEAP